MVLVKITNAELNDAMSLARARVRHYMQLGWHKSFSFDDLLSAAYEGICEARLNFQPDKGTVKDTKFTSYAYFWIEKYIKEYITKNKTMLGGSAGELWSGQVPYTQSIDARDDGNDAMGSDHYAWLGTTEMASTPLETKQKASGIQKMLAKVFTRLDANERLCMQLTLGIGTVHGNQLTLIEIGHAINKTRKEVSAIIDSAIDKMFPKLDQFERAVVRLMLGIGVRDCTALSVEEIACVLNATTDDVYCAMRNIANRGSDVKAELAADYEESVLATR